MVSNEPGWGFGRRCGALFRIVLRLIVLATAVYAVHLILDWASARTQDGQPELRLSVLVALIAIYIILMALPFVPGVELSTSLLIIEGRWIAPVIYVATLAGLFLAYGAGRWLPAARMGSLFHDLHLRKAGDFMDQIRPLSSEERLALLSSRVPAWLRPIVTKYRFVLLAVLLNTPGNAIVGGGGGIMFVAGLSRMFSTLATALTLAIAVAPVPLMVWILGIATMSR